MEAIGRSRTTPFSFSVEEKHSVSETKKTFGGQMPSEASKIFFSWFSNAKIIRK